MIHIINPITGEEADVYSESEIPDGWIRILVQVETSARKPLNWFLLAMLFIVLYYMFRR